MGKLDWQAARTRDSHRKQAAIADAQDQLRREEERTQRDPEKPSFSIVYARYANRERAAGRKALPPKQWIQSLQEMAREKAKLAAGVTPRRKARRASPKHLTSHSNID